MVSGTTPRVFLARHGETEWTLNGRWTGITELALTPAGEAQVLRSAHALVGAGRLIDPARLARVFVSPRRRAQRTFALLFGDDHEAVGLGDAKLAVDEHDIAEWGYGDYEGLVTEDIRALRKERGLDLDKPWDIWRDGCEGEGAESPEQVTVRLDRLIGRIKDIQHPSMHGGGVADVLVVGDNPIHAYLTLLCD